MQAIIKKNVNVIFQVLIKYMNYINCKARLWHFKGVVCIIYFACKLYKLYGSYFIRDSVTLHV